jgi:hypothetical protein
MNNTEWIFKDGASQTTWNSFPYAYRAMFQSLKSGVERGRKYNDMVKQMVIIAPTKDQHGDPRRYNYTSATDLAKSSGLLTPNGEINSREFGKKR